MLGELLPGGTEDGPVGARSLRRRPSGLRSAAPGVVAGATPRAVPVSAAAVPGSGVRDPGVRLPGGAPRGANREAGLRTDD